MKVVRLLPLSILILLISVLMLPVMAADCPAIVKTALDATDNICSSIGRNQACYGNILLTAEPQADVASFNFSKPGDLVNVDGIKTLSLDPLDQAADTWGIALMKIQANLPDTLPGQNITFLMFGDVQIDNAVKSAAQAPKLQVTAKQGMNVRQIPSKTGSVLTSVKRGDTLTATGRLEDGSWLRVKVADTGAIGWISSPLISSSGDINTLEAVTADTPVYNPMQAFYFKTGLNDAPCSEAPDSGILVQTPKGVGKVQITANGVDLSLGSTVYLQAQPGGFMTISVIEGNITVRANGVQQAIPAGTFTQIPLDVNSNATGSPQFPQPYIQAKLQPLPIQVLPDTITIAAPLSTTEINGAIASAEGLPLPGKWRIVVGISSVCGARYPGPSTETLTVENDGASILLGAASLPSPYTPYRYNRTAPGTYILADLPRDYRQQLGILNIRQTEVMTIVSPTAIRIDATDFFPSSNCNASVPSTLTYMGS